MNTNETTTTTRVDLHCHSTASAVAKLGVSRALGLPECATPPEEVYELAKRRGMDFVTITDHDVIDGAVELAERYDDAFVSVELTARFARADQAVHVLCWGITPDQHDALQDLADDVEEVAAYLAEQDIASALAHPFFNVGAPLQPVHRRRLAQLFGAWEVRNGARAPELNAPATIYIETHGGTGTGGSDDHAGVDIGRTWTEAPAADDWRGFLGHLRAGRVEAGGDEGSAAKWAHAALAIAIRTLGRAEPGPTHPAPDVAAVLAMAQQVGRTGDVLGRELQPDDARALVNAWLDAVGVDEDPVALLQRDGHAGLARRARKVHERKLRDAARAPVDGTLPVRVFEACLPAVPYAPAAAFLGREIGNLARRPNRRPRVAIVADGIGATHGVTRTVEQIRERGVPGFDVEVIGTDPSVDRRLASVADVDLGGVSVGVPCLPAVVEALTGYDMVHVTAPGPAGIAAALVAEVSGLPLVGSYHTELAAYAGQRTGDQAATIAMTAVLSVFYGRCQRVLSPSSAADAALAGFGISAAKMRRWDRGVDLNAFGPEHRVDHDPDRVDVLYAGRLAAEKGTELLADAFLGARERDPRLHLVLAGGGPEEATLRARLGEHATFLGWLEDDALATAYASADLFCFGSETDTFGQVVLEAQASGVPVVVVDAGGPAELVQDGRTGVKCPPDAAVMAEALAGLARSRRARRRLVEGGLDAVQTRTWERSMARLADGWSGVLQDAAERRAA